MICVGRDDKDFEAVFNVDSFIQKLSVVTTKDNQVFYDPAIIKEALLSKIRRISN